jgi:hypothetical protein
MRAGLASEQSRDGRMSTGDPLTPRSAGQELSLLRACIPFALPVPNVRLVQPVACRVVPKWSQGGDALVRRSLPTGDVRS